MGTGTGTGTALDCRLSVRESVGFSGLLKVQTGLLMGGWLAEWKVRRGDLGGPEGSWALELGVGFETWEGEGRESL